MNGFVYIIDRGGELDVYESRADAETAADIMGGAEIVEQVVFGESGANDDEHPGGGTQGWLDVLRREYDHTGLAQ